jgi:ribonuclease J
MVTVIDTAKGIGCLSIPDNTLIEIEKLKNYPPEQTVLITTGSQGESMAALSRMANGTHRKVKIGESDAVIFSSHPIPGNEKAVTKVINELYRKGADVIFQDAHVSGHACREEIKLIYALTQPKYAIPVHGEYKHLKAQERLALELGLDKKNIFIMNSGDVLEMDKNAAKVIDHVQAGGILVDGLGVGDVGNVVLKDRQHLAEDGIIICTLALSRGTNTLVSQPVIQSRGFVYVRESEELMRDMQKAVLVAVDRIIEKDINDRNKIRTSLRDAVSDFVWRKTKRRPMILPIIIEAD